jgi:K+-sensing histidine kinase KdpD
MRNLIENATKYSKRESPILVTAAMNNSNLIVQVQDEGPGIPDEERKMIFESFYRLDDDGTRRMPGFGLGLSICQGFIKAHGGEIWTEECDTGACIAFSLPAMTSVEKLKHG